MARRFLFAALCIALSGCGGARPPAELSGLWSAGEGACGAGMGVRFDQDAIVAVYDRQREPLFSRPHYAVMGGGGFRVRIAYELPERPGGVRVTGAQGVLVLERAPGGGLRLASHNLLDARTGSARVRIADDPAARLLQLTPCDGRAWREELRGRGEGD